MMVTKRKINDITRGGGSHLLSTLKINHYVKNLVVIVPLLFSMNLFNITAWFNAAIIFVAFCFVASAVYILNDIKDIESDKTHPIKCLRPIASGLITQKQALTLMSTLLILGLLCAASLNILCTLTLIAYFVLNVFYTYSLKNIELIDVACIAVGFILRILAGCYAIYVLPSPLVILLTFFISMFFTFSKRKLELELVNDNSRKSLKGFDIQTINQFILINAILAISFYFTYVLDENTIMRAGTPYLYVTVIPFTLIMFRLLLLVNKKCPTDDPIHFIEKDKPLKWLAVFYLIILAIVMTAGRF